MSLDQRRGYTLQHWTPLFRHIGDRYVGINNNLVEHSMRPLALGRKITCL